MSLIIEAISNTHNQHEDLELKGGDILIHSGDATGRGTLEECHKFLEWYSSLLKKYNNVIFTPGNHDFWFEEYPEVSKKYAEQLGITYLNDSGVELEGLYFWGSPVTPWFCDWAFNRLPVRANTYYDKRTGVTIGGKSIGPHWDLIPENTDVLITHGPPHMILDYAPMGEHVGCEILMDKITKIKPKLHVFGHIHENSGFKSFNGTLFANASCLDGWYNYHKDSATIKFADDLTIEDFYDNIKGI